MAPRKGRTIDSDDDNDEENERGTPQSGGLKRRKRARLSDDAEQLSASDESNSSLPNGVASQQSAWRKEHSQTGSSSKVHKPGAIIRVKLTNFVTYTSAEFYPGPSLNMVIGPNGTGKSTLVCAICLGLGWGPQ
ncbi:MAG: hypothetical protein Q9160_001051, partial [Pyrenula sp. 1 TL-2023]